MNDCYEYIALVRKADGKQVYTSPAYYMQGYDNAYDFPAIKRRLVYYFDRVNDGIQQQLDNPRLSAEQKKELKLLDKADYVVRSVCQTPLGVMSNHFNWESEAAKLLA